MNRGSAYEKLLSVFAILALGISSFLSFQPTISASASHTSNPSSVTLAGSLQE